MEATAVTSQDDEGSTMSAPQRVLSIQSHVVSGYVGNKAAVFPLQLLGFDVDVVNSVHFSNHTGYPNRFTGDVLKGEQLRALMDGLEGNRLLHGINHLLTGYIGSESFLESVLDVLAVLRKYNASTRYVCDPVLGDHGKFYAPPGLVEVYKTRVLPQADVLTPNQFEVEQLTGIVVTSIDTAQQACRALHDMGPSIVVITSVVIPSSTAKVGGEASGAASSDNNNNDDDTRGMAILASQRQPGDDGTTQMWKIECPMLPGHFTGTGDLFACLLLAHTALRDNDLPGALEQVINTMYAVIEQTHQFAERQADPTAVYARELQLIRSKALIENPPQRFHATRIQ